MYMHMCMYMCNMCMRHVHRFHDRFILTYYILTGRRVELARWTCCAMRRSPYGTFAYSHYRFPSPVSDDVVDKKWSNTSWCVLTIGPWGRGPGEGVP